ncbi:hypothetical protein E5D57_001835 [Metarhizium anisopliae]|nr:hypothetical protein E5D57_001835 [Metarhizium anisopliae]
MTSLAGVPEQDAKAGGVDRPISGAIAEEIVGSCIVFGVAAAVLEVGGGPLNDGRKGCICPKLRL